MSDLVNISEFSYESGLDLGKNNQSFTYLYGLSDFWQYLFQDTSSANLLMETTSLQASDIYTTFTQFCAGISVADISTSASSQLRLEIISNVGNLPANRQIASGSWASGFTTIQVNDLTNFAVGDTIVVSGVEDLITYDIGNGINFNPINHPTRFYTIGGANWNGTFTITSILLGGYITYYQPTNPGSYTKGGLVNTASIGTETYQLPEAVSTTRFISNKPFLPNIVLEEDVDYHIDPSTFRISFAQPLDSYGFLSRVTSQGTKEYSVWFIDARYDEDLIYEQYPILLGRTKPTISDESYRNFLYGLYYVYTSGPTLSVIEKGLNLVLGIPLARDEEVVLEIRPYLNTSQFIVITDLNSYVIPVGLIPSVFIGDTLQIGDELAKWVEILDYQSSGAWWRYYGVSIPPELMPHVPTGHTRYIGNTITYPGYDVGDTINGNAINDGGTPDPYIVEDYADWIMTYYLKNHTFLVKVNVSESDFLKIQKFESIPDLLLELKPRHTYPIYVYNTSSNTKNIVKVVGSLTAGAIGTSISVNISSVSGSGIAGTIQGGLSLLGVVTPSTVSSTGVVPSRVININGIQINSTIATLSTVGVTSISSTTLAGNIDVAVEPTPLYGEVADAVAGNISSEIIPTTLDGAHSFNSLGSLGIGVEARAILATTSISILPAYLNGTFILDGSISLNSTDKITIGVALSGNIITPSVGTVV